LQSGQSSPQPRPAPVFVTSAPASRTINMPAQVAAVSHLNVDGRNDDTYQYD